MSEEEQFKVPSIEETLNLLKAIEREAEAEREAVTNGVTRLEQLEERLAAAKKLFKKLARRV